MSKTFEFEQTSLPSQFVINVKDNYGYLFTDSNAAEVYRVILVAVSNVLKFNQNTNYKRIGFTIKDDKGNFKFGAIMSYKKPEEGSEDDAGNWFLEYTFYEDDMTDLDLDLDNHSDIFIKCMTQAVFDICGGRFRNTSIMYNLVNTAIDTLTTFLDVNATEGEVVELTLRSVFVASVAIENGEKVMSIVPGEWIKQLIKNDAVL